jgi:hypothetical protein
MNIQLDFSKTKLELEAMHEREMFVDAKITP